MQLENHSHFLCGRDFANERPLHCHNWQNQTKLRQIAWPRSFQLNWTCCNLKRDQDKCLQLTHNFWDHLNWDGSLYTVCVPSRQIAHHLLTTSEVPDMDEIEVETYKEHKDTQSVKWTKGENMDELICPIW